MGCLGRLGCLVLILVGLAAAYLTRDRWMIGVRRRPETAARSSGPTWQPLTRTGAARADQALTRLSQPTGPVFANLAGADAASYVYQRLAKELPPSADSLDAAVIGDELCLRASVLLGDLGGAQSLGPLAGFLTGRDRMQFCGTFDVLRPGLAEYQVRELRLRDFAVPSTAIPGLLRKVERGSRPEGVAPNGLPLVIPKFLGDIRIAAGKVTLYKTT